MLLASALILAGCGSVIEEGPGAGTPSDQPTSIHSAEPSPTIQQDDESNAPTPDSPQDNGTAHDELSMDAGMPSDPDNPGFRRGPAFANDDGTFYRIIMPDDYEGIDDSDVVSDAALDVSGSELAEALLLTGRFAAEELAGSELAFNYTAEGAEAWLNASSDLFVYPDRVAAGLLGPESSSLALLYTDNGWERGTPSQASRIQGLDVTLVSVTQDGDQLTITYDVSFEAEVTGTAGLDGPFTEKTRISAVYTVERVDGTWKIADYETSWSTEY